MKITQRDLKKYVWKMLKFIESDEPTTLDLNEKDYDIIITTIMMYRDDKEDEGLQWGIDLITSVMDKCLQNVKEFGDFIEKVEKDFAN